MRDVNLEHLVPSAPRVRTTRDELAKALKRLLANDSTLTIEAVANRICRSPRWVRQLLEES